MRSTERHGRLDLAIERRPIQVFHPQLHRLDAPAHEPPQAVVQVDHFLKVTEELGRMRDEITERMQHVTQALATVTEQAQIIQAATAEQGRGSEEIAHSTARLTELTEGISSATEEQAAGAVQIVHTLQQMEKMVQGHTTTAGNLAAAAEDMALQAASLQEGVRRFLLERDQKKSRPRHALPATFIGGPESILRPGQAAPPSPPPTTKEEPEVQDLKRALRWTMGYLVNVTLGVERVVGHQANILQIRHGIREGIARAGVPRGILRSLHQAEAILKEWDQKTFRIEQEIQLQRQDDEGLVFQHPRCAKLLDTMREIGHYQISNIQLEPYAEAMDTPLWDFVCVPCQLCRSELVSWLSDGQFTTQEVYNSYGCRDVERGVCGFQIRPEVKTLRGSRE
jgi:hypothetical protein